MRPLAGIPNKKPQRGRGVRRVPGQMNGLERAYSLHLEARKHAGEVLWWAFDCVKLRLAEKTFYTPDFLVMNADLSIEVHETKGTSKGKPFVEDDAAVKIKVAAELFPFGFVMIWRVAGEWKARIY